MILNDQLILQPFIQCVIFAALFAVALAAEYPAYPKPAYPETAYPKPAYPAYPKSYDVTFISKHQQGRIICD